MASSKKSTKQPKGKRALQAKHLYALRFVSEPRLNHDASLALAVHTHIHQPKDDKEAPSYRSQIYLYDLKEGSSRPLTTPEDSSRMPRFSPDGSMVSFVSKRANDESPQLYLLPLAGGEAQRITTLARGVHSYCWHPHEATIAYTSLGDEAPAPADQARRIDNLIYRMDGVGFLPEQPLMLYLYDHDKARHKSYDLKARNVTAMRFSPDGKYLYIKAEDAQSLAEGQSHFYRMSMRNRSTSKTPYLSHYFAQGVAIADDGRLAYYAPSQHDPQDFAYPTGLWLSDAKGKNARLLSGELAAVPSAGGDSHYGALPVPITWLDDRRLLIIANERGRSGLAELETENGHLHYWQQGDFVVSSYHHRAGYTLFIKETPEQPAELFVREPDGSERQLSYLNAEFLRSYQFGSVSEEKSAKAEDGEKLPYWLMQPTKPRKDNALVLQVHGGPQSNYGYGFYFEFHLLASQGYTVVFGNPRGGSSYGSSFQRALLGKYGSVDASDVMTIARKARKKHSDSKAPMHLTGGSYGGFMTNWLIGQENSKDFFASAVTQRSICNWLSFHGTSDIGARFTTVQQGGNPWDDTERLWQQSPLKYVAAVQTPLLIIHASEDYRCPIGQAEELFTALKVLGKEVAFLRVPGEGHELLRSGRPDRRVARLEAILDWFDSH